MPRLIITARARAGFARCHDFLVERDDQAARRAGLAITRQLDLLERTPTIGRPFRGDPMLRELVIGFGSTGYVALYRHDLAEDAIYVLAFRHQREAGY